VKKIGILTYVCVGNYGTELQAFALERAVNCLGHDAEVIDFKYRWPSRYRKRFRYLSGFFSRLFRGEFKAIIHLSLAVLGRTTPLPVARKWTEICRRRQQRFEAFFGDTRHSAVAYTRELLYANPPLYDVFVVGSDQVWNRMFTDMLDVFFLNFVTNDSCRIAYAASIGIRSIPLSLRATYRKGLAAFHAISIRERYGCRVVESLVDRPVAHVLDPTLLLSAEAWRKECLPVEVTSPYILLSSVTASPSLRTMALKLSEATRIPVISLYPEHDECDRPKVINRYDAGPREFLALVSNAALVLTDSFHSTAFAINFGVNFLAVVAAAASKRISGRLEDLLDLVGLRDRLVVVTESLSELPPNIDYVRVHAVLAEKREQSLKWLVNSLESCAEKK
jgi:hypothetical protein